LKIQTKNKTIVKFAPQHSIRQIVNPSELPIDQIVALATSHTNILPAIYFSIKARYSKTKKGLSFSQYLFFSMINHKIVLHTFERLRLDMSGGEIQENILHQQRDLFEKHRFND
jgi:hypothetical protein